MIQLNLKDLVAERGMGKRFLVEAVHDHGMVPEDIIREGQIGIAYDFWYWGGNLREIAVAVQWRKSSGRNYFQKYNRAGIVTRPITEIIFLKELVPGEHCNNVYCACKK